MHKHIATFLFSLFLPISAFCADYYWIGGSGNWSDISHWATTSGGTVTHPQVPTANDNVFFDQNSFTAPGSLRLPVVRAAFVPDGGLGTGFPATSTGGSPSNSTPKMFARSASATVRRRERRDPSPASVEATAASPEIRSA